MKKVTSFILALLLMVSMFSFTAYAEGNGKNHKNNNKIEKKIKKDDKKENKLTITLCSPIRVVGP